MHRHTGPAPGIMVWGGTRFHCRTPLVRIAGTLNSQRYISEGALGSLVFRASDFRLEGLDSMPNAIKYSPSTHGVRAR
ncbi:hypothetical protein TNCV_281781 [Trichonephila clavipes]|nr:hypothetical protein TNCV_281781 [Trichonephila clavipes]